MQRASILPALILTIATATGCYSQSPQPDRAPVSTADSVSASDLSGALYCELGQPGMICLSVSEPSTGGVIEYAITRDDCLELGTLTGSNALTFLPSPGQPSCIGGSSPAYRATAVFVDAGIDLTLTETQATIELEQVQ